MTELKPQRALVIVAHPDDIEYFCGGTLAQWVQQGTTVTYLITTAGDKGTHDVSADIEHLMTTRKQEQHRSAKIVGVNDVIFLHYPDSELSFVNHQHLRQEYVRHIRRTKPQVIVTHDPMVRLVKQHPDHRVVGQVAMDAAYPISVVAQCYPEQILHGLSPWQAEEILLFGTDQANYAVDISATLDLKIAALLEHTSQQAAFAGGIEERIRWKAKLIGRTHGLNAAEEFLRVRLAPTLPTEGDQ